MKFNSGAFRKPCHALHLESLEKRELLAVLLDPLTQAKFVNPLPNPLAPAAIFAPTTAGQYEIGVHQIEQNLGLVDPATGLPLTTTVWGYGNDEQPATYPGRTIVAQRDEAINVHWTNELVDEDGDPLPHLLPVDTSVHWAMPMDPDYPDSGVPVVTHLHGGHTESESDGIPEAWFTPEFAQTGAAWAKENYHYDNDQQAATLWYHDHALGITRLNVYAGLAGFYILRDDMDTGLPDDPDTLDDENPLNLPVGPYEVPLVIQDRMFTADGELYYPSEPEEDGAPDPSVLPEFFGDFILVNGQAWPVLDVEPRPYRFRMLNGSDSRFYDLAVTGGTGSVGPDILQIGTDDGLLYQPVALDRLTLGPGERADVIVDFADDVGKTLIVRNTARSPFPKGDTVDPLTTGQIMAFRVSKPLDTTQYPVEELAATLRDEPIAPLVQTGATRELLLFEATDEYGRLRPQLGTVDDGALMWDDPTTETPSLNDVEVWEIYNSTEDAHPIHLHLVSFQVQNRQKFKADQDSETGALSNIRVLGQPASPEANELGWKDTVIMYPGQVTRIIAKFDRTGEYVWHCHILSHEDHEMMRRFEVIDPDIAEADSVQDYDATPLTSAVTMSVVAMTSASSAQTATETARAGQSPKPGSDTDGQAAQYLVREDNARSLVQRRLATELLFASVDEERDEPWYAQITDGWPPKRRRA